MSGSIRFKLLALAVVPTVLAVLVVGAVLAYCGEADQLQSIVYITIVVALFATSIAFAIALPVARRVSTRIQQLQELIVHEAERAADERRLVLDHVNQGLFAVTYDGALVGERSRATDALLGATQTGDNLVEIVRKHDPRIAAGFALGFAQLASDVLPTEIALFQLPRELFARGRTLSFDYTPFSDPTGPRLLVTITDITEEREHAEAREVEEETAAFFRQLATDRHGLRRFVDDARTQIELIGAARSTTLVFGALHTLKGNAGLMGLDAWVARCHEAESVLTENGELTPDQRQEIVWAWSATEDRVVPFLERQSSIEVSAADFAELVRVARQKKSWTDVRGLLRDVTLESTAMPLHKLADHCRELASRHGRPLGRLVVEDHGIRLDPDRWGPLWSALTHVVRNVVIHGMHEAAPTDIALRTFRDGDGVTIEIADGGRGIQWESLRDRARANGLPCESRDDLVAAMFTSQISTREVIDETAGRGVGLAAVAATCNELGVSFELPVQPHGTTFRFHLPVTESRMSLSTIATPPLPQTR